MIADHPRETLETTLDWQQFSARFFPLSRRHDLKALVSYGEYRRMAARPSANEATLLAWESEGGRPDAGVP